MMRARVLAAAVGGLLASAFGCGDGSSSSPDAAPPDAAPLTIGEICDLLTPVTCERDAECFDSFPLPCPESFREACCEGDGSCSLINGVRIDQVMDCIAAMDSITCEDIETNFPEPCNSITSSPAALESRVGRLREPGLWSSDRLRGR